MARIKCFVCGRRYSDSSEFCPECSYPTKQIKRETELENHFYHDKEIKSTNKSTTKEFNVKSWVERSKNNSTVNRQSKDNSSPTKKKTKIKFGIIIYIIWVFGKRIVSAIRNIIEEFGGTDLINRIISNIKELI